jgi:hypothetical protein
MADVFYIILAVYVLWRIFGGTVKTHVVHHHYTETKKEGEVQVSKISDPVKKSSGNQGEYVDYEEMK